jgi:toxin ParE1/3/4
VKKIRWTAEASDQFVSAIEHIQEDNPSAAKSVAEEVLRRVEQLTDFPHLGRRGEVQGTRELSIPPHVIVYRVADDVVEVLHLWYGAQDWR